MLTLFNTLSGKREEFRAIREHEVSMYNCGPTVYNYAHIGNMRSYVFADILRRTLEYGNFKVKQVINITDVGHIIADADSGEDKIEKAAQEAKKTAHEITDFYTDAFMNDLKLLNIETEETLFPKATEHIQEQIDLILELEKNGYTYTTTDGVYFNTSKFPNYGKLGNIDVGGLKEGARVEINPEKKNPTDFALWKFSKKGEIRQQQWPSPWGLGFPGWHIECSAMSMKYLGETFDIHTGGIDHIPVHHNNEIAQSESATKKKYVNYWLHNAFVNIEGGKMAKSEGNFLRLETLVGEGIDPIAYRFWLLSAHYRTQVSFSLEAIIAAQNGYKKLQTLVSELPDGGTVDTQYKKKFEEKINDDLDTPAALALVFELLKDTSISPQNKKITILDFDRVLGLKLNSEIKPEPIPKEIMMLGEERETARQAKNWELADQIREKIEIAGYNINDGALTYTITKR